MSEKVGRLSIQIGASSLVLLAALYSTALHAQTPPTSSDILRNNAEEQIRNRSDEELFRIEKEIEKEKKKKAINKDKAADELQGKDDDDSGILAKLPSYENLEKLMAKIQAEPNNLDHYFAFAQMASQLGEYEKAAQTYEFMLKLAPKLDRVRLDLGATYLRLGRFEDAKRELSTVLDKNPPESVRANIENVLSKVDYELSEHDITGLITAGINLDSNGNSAAESDSIVIFDTEIPLTAEQRAQQDLQFFTAVNVDHVYRPRWAQSDTFSRRWKSTASFYRAKQSSLENLDLQVYSIKTGPEFQSMQSGITVSPSVSRNQIVLAEQTYLRTTSLGLKVDYPVTPKLFLSAETTGEFREFENSTDVSTYEDRTGSATQHRVSGRYALTAKDFVNASVTHRRERTRVEYFDNAQIGGTVGYTRLLPYDFFVSTNLGYKSTVYDARDPLISTKTRKDKEQTFGVTVGHKISEDVTATVGYQYRDINSNIQNYEYENHRWAGAVSYRF